MRFTIAVVPPSQKEIAIATATSLMPSALWRSLWADADADGICATWTSAWAPLMLDGLCTVKARSTTAAVQTSQLAIATDGNQLDALGECGGPCAADANSNGIATAVVAVARTTLATTILRD